ncbi:MAG: DUF5711 family protein [Oscillospiraceae bacterium]|nr:DUF5711 family protein [Oscillospiraceae bacterium]
MSKNSHLNKSSAHRAEKKREKRTLKLIILCFICFILLVIVVAVLNIDKLSDSVEGIGRRSRNVAEAGFPLRLPGNTGYDINRFDSGFMLLTETYVYVHEQDGGQRYNKRHNYSEPNAAIASTRILVYDKNRDQFSFFGRNGLIYEKKTDERILYGAIGENNSAAIVYRSDVYANVLEIYDSDGDWRYRNRFLDENIMQVVFTSADNEIIVTTMGFNEGEVSAFVQKYDTTIEDEAGVWKTALPGSAMPLAVHIGRNNVFVLCDNGLFILDLNDGAVLDNHGYNGNLIDFAFSDNLVAILINDYAAGTVSLVSISDDDTQSRAVSAGALQAEILNGKIYLLEPSRIAVFDIGDIDGIAPEYMALNEEYSRFIHVGDEILLLGFNNVDKLLSDTEQHE